MHISKKLAVLTGAAVAVAVGIGSAAFALGGHPSQTSGESAADGFYACIAAGNKVANAYPTDGWHGTECPSNQVLYRFPSQAGMEKALAAQKTATDTEIANVQAQATANAANGYEEIGRPTDGKDVPPGQTVRVHSLCNSHGEYVIGGGVRVTGPGMSTTIVNSSAPDDMKQIVDPTTGDPSGRWVSEGWTAWLTNTGTATAHAQPEITCAQVNVTVKPGS